MTSNEYLELFEKYLSGNASPEEVDVIMAYRDGFDLADLDTTDELQYAAIKSRIQAKLKADIVPQKQHRIYPFRWLAATAAVLLTAIGVYFTLVAPLSQTNKKQQLAVGQYKNDVPSPGNQAMLTLGNGRIIPLKELESISSLKQKASLIKSKGNGIIQYSSLSSTGQNAAVEYNSISTANGGQYAIILSDGTKVWLNAASTLTYPTAFNGNDRTVQLTGEAYFEVAKNKNKPFKVEFNHQVVQVLGTHFNIMAYADEDHNSATLLEGSIKIIRGDIARIIKPGEQAMCNKVSKDIAISKANTDDVMSWKNGYFLFKNENIQAIMRKVSRWYNVDVQYQGDLKNQIYGGRISSSKNLSEILKNLELTGTIHFKIEGRKLTVME